METYAHLMNTSGLDATIREDRNGVAVDIARHEGAGEWPIIETRVFTGENAFYRAEAFAKRRL